MVHQHDTLMPNLSFAKNILLGQMPRRLGRVLDWTAAQARARAILAERGYPSLDVRAPAWRLSAAQRQVAEIAKAVAVLRRVLILDEPTASLTQGEADRPFAFLRACRDRGVAIVYISHRLHEVLALADHVTALRDGLVTGSLPAREADKPTPIRLMVGRAIADLHPRPLAAAPAPELSVRVIVADGGGDVAKVTSDIEDLLARNVNGLIMNISSLESLPGPMAAIQRAGKRLVLVNRKLTGGHYDAWVGVGNRLTAEGVGEVIVRHMNRRGVLLMMMRGGPEDNSTGNARRDGVLAKVQGTGIEVLIAPEFRRWTEDGGIRMMEDMLAKHRRIDAVFCETDSMCLGAQKAIADAGRTNEISIFGFDGKRAAIEQIARGTNYIGSGQKPPAVIARIGFEKMMTLLAGGTVPKDTITPVVVITRENAAKLLDPTSVF